MSGLINLKGEELVYPGYTTDDEEDWSYAELYHDQIIEDFVTYKDLDDSFFIHDMARGDDMMLPYNVKEVFPYKNGLCKVVLEGLKGRILTSYIGVY